MDYKELIERLRKYADFGGRIEVCADALTALETLLAERDAAVEKMRGDCDECVDADTPAHEYPCVSCRFCMYGKNSGTEYWKWRGATPPERQQMES